MNRKTISFYLAAIVLIALILTSYRTSFRDATEVAKMPPKEQASFDGKNSAFAIDGEIITLKNGISETEQAPSSASKSVVRFLGNESIGDLNGDGLADIAFLVTKETGGSGLFYYAVVALKTPDGYKTTNACYVGDRIKPQSIMIHEDSKQLDINFAERKLEEPMSAEPTSDAVLLLKVTPAGVLEGLMK